MTGRTGRESPTCREFAEAIGEGPEGLAMQMFVLASLVVLECEAERYEWAAFWRDEAKYLYGEGKHE